MWWREHKWKVIAPVLVVAALAFAFWYGGGPRHGWTVSRETAAPPQSAAPSPTAAPTPVQAAADTTVPEDLPPTAMPTDTSTAAPMPSVEPTPTGMPLPTADVSGEEAPAAETPVEPTPTAASTPAPWAEETVTPAPPVEPSPAEMPAQETPAADTVTVSISCANLLDHLDEAEEAVAALVPPDGWLLAPTEVALSEGESAFDLLERVCRDNQLHMEFSNTPLYDSAYIEGIGNLYEFDFGEQSGWMYAVNGVFPNYGCSGYVLQPGDVVEWAYTLDLGKDLGGTDLGQ